MTRITGNRPALHRFMPTAPALVRPRIGLEGAFFVVFLLFTARAFLDLLGGAASNKWLVHQILWAVVYFVVVVLTHRRFGLRSLLSQFRWFPGISIVLLLAVLSTAWSVDPAVTIWRSMSLVGSTLVGFYIGFRFSPPQLLQILSWAFAVFILLSVATAAAIPAYGTMIFVSENFANTDAWKGITYHKGKLGTIAAMGAIFFLVRASTGDMNRLLGSALFCLSFLTVVMSDSMTGMGMVVSGIVMLAFCLLSKRLQLSYAAITIFAFAGLLALAANLTLGWDLILDSFSRDQTLTGRTLIWNDAMRLISNRPLLGYGYNAVWGFKAETQFRSYLSVAYTPHAHNGYLGIAVELGVPAAILSTGLVLAMLLQSIRAISTQISSYYLYVAAYMFMFFTFNFIESGLFKRQDFFWIMFVSLSVSLVANRKIKLLQDR